MDKQFLKPVLKPSGEDIFLLGAMFLLIFLNLIYSMFPIRPMVYRILIMLLCGFIVLIRKRIYTLPEKIIVVFLVVNFVYFVFALINRNLSTSTIGNAMIAMFPVLVFSYFAGKGCFTEKCINALFVILLLGSIVYYFDYQLRFMERVSREENLTINASSVFLFLIPLLFYVKNKCISWGGIAICMFFVISAVKRGNLVASVGPLLLFGYYQIKKGKSIRNRLFILLISLVGFYFLYRLAISSSYFLARLEDSLEGNLSGRETIYGNAYQIWAGSSFSQFFFGHGFDATLKLMRTHAHSDWLEILVDYGFMGAALYLALFVSLGFQLKHCRTLEDKCVLLSVLYIWIVKSIISMAYFEPWMILLMISLGIAMSHSNKNLFVLQSRP